ncbi:hypothetical protein H1C71_018730, partial [Ictidomys tridecemlineatus]
MCGSDWVAEGARSSVCLGGKGLLPSLHQTRSPAPRLDTTDTLFCPTLSGASEDICRENLEEEERALSATRPPVAVPLPFPRNLAPGGALLQLFCVPISSREPVGPGSQRKP